MITRSISILLPALLVAVLGGRASAQYSSTQPPSSASKSPGAEAQRQVVVEPLRHSAGSQEYGPDGKTLEARFSEALRGYLQDMAEGHYQVVDRFRRDKRTLIRFTLSGDLSTAENDEDTGSSYLCVLRLFQEGKTRRLVGHWAGSARTLRDLTNNLSRDPKQHTLGLLGELGNQVTKAISRRKLSTDGVGFPLGH